MINKKRFPWFLMLFLRSLLLSLLWNSAAWSACAISSGGDTNMQMTLVKDFSLGHIVTPDTGKSGFVQIKPDDARSISGELYIGDKNTNAVSDSYATAEVEVTGAPDCSYRLAVNGSLPSRVASVQVAIDGAAQASLPVNGTLSASGISRIKFFLRVLVYDTDTSDILEDIPLRVEWLGY